jgi:hypothetical protein
MYAQIREDNEESLDDADLSAYDYLHPNSEYEYDPEQFQSILQEFEEMVCREKDCKDMCLRHIGIS